MKRAVDAVFGHLTPEPDLDDLRREATSRPPWTPRRMTTMTSDRSGSARPSPDPCPRVQVQSGRCPYSQRPGGPLNPPGRPPPGPRKPAPVSVLISPAASTSASRSARITSSPTSMPEVISV
jgi:hypothetical protein